MSIQLKQVRRQNSCSFLCPPSLAGSVDTFEGHLDSQTHETPEDKEFSIFSGGKVETPALRGQSVRLAQRLHLSPVTERSR